MSLANDSCNLAGAIFRNSCNFYNLDKISENIKYYRIYCL
jgi:hypothetical protein